METIGLGPGFGAELRGVGLADIVADDARYRAVREIFEAQSLLLFRRQQVTDALQEAFSARFGPLELTKVGSLGAGTHFVTLTNIGPDGGLVPPDHREALTARANQLWHTDSSFKPIPALASVLSARTIPGHGGETEFASTRLAWDRLDPGERAWLEGAVAAHDYAHSRGQIATDLTTSIERTALPPQRWRMVWRNPANGRRAVYVASHAFAIDGMERPAAQARLAALIEAATQPQLTYLHRWAPGDVVMWDNRAMLHRGRSWPDGEPRHMVRTTISATDADGLSTVRPAS